MAESRGFPDWKERSAETSQQILRQVINLAANGSINSFSFYLGGARGLGVRLSQVTGGRIRFVARFNGDVNAGQVTDDYMAVVRAGDEYHDMYPIIAPYMFFSLDEMAGVASSVEVILYTSMSVGRPYTENVRSTIMIDEDFRLVPAATVEYVNATQVRPGPAHVELASRATTWSAAIVAVDDMGTERYVVIVDNMIGNYIGQIYLPPLPIRARFNNADGVAQRFRILLHSQPGHPG